MRRRSERDTSIQKEVQTHFEMAVRERIERGESPEAARRAALREFGNIALIVEDSRSVWRWTTVEQLVADVRAGFRILTRARTLSLSAILLIALVIGGNTTIFSAASSLVNKPAPGVRPEGLVSPGWTRGSDDSEPELSWPDFQDLASAARTVDLAAWHQSLMTIQIESGVYSVPGEMVTPTYFTVLRQSPARGRFFTSADRDNAHGLSAVISERLWRTYFDGRDDIAGSVVTVNSRAVTVIGVAAPPFQGPWTGQAADIWVPIEHARELSPSLKLSDRSVTVFDGSVGRLRVGVSFGQAQAELRTLAATLPVAVPPEPGAVPRTLTLFPYSGTAARDIGIIRQMPMFMTIFALITVATLVIVCANVSNLMLARALTRQREMALRQSLGASRLRVVRVVLAEGFAVALAAWVVACVFAWWMSQLLPSLIPPSEGGGVPLQLDFRPDWLTLAYAFGLAIVGTAALSLAPAISTWRQDLLSFLKAGERGAESKGASASRVLVVTQLALAVTLLTSTGLAYRSLALIDSTDPGFNTRGITLITLDVRQAASGGEAATSLLNRMAVKIAALPGIRGVAFASMPPSWAWPDVEVRTPAAATTLETERTEISPGYFAALGLPVIQGREFNGTSDDRSRAVVTQALAARLWPNGQTAIGQTLLVGSPERTLTVVGVAKDAYYGGFRNSGLPPVLFTPTETMAPEASGYPTLYVFSSDAEGIGTDVRRALAEVDPRVPVMRLRPMDTDLDDLTWMSRAMTFLLTLFAMGSLLIAALGQYAAMAFAAQRRTRELAIRLALGATGRQVTGEVLGNGLKLTALGLAIGLGLGILIGQLAQGLLYGTSPADVVSLAAVTGILAVVSLLACYVPAWRASRVDPLAVLRQE